MSELVERFQRDGRAVTHSLRYEKILGYLYCPDTDKLSINKFSTDTQPKLSKRLILSYMAKIFDPFGLALPISVKGKYLMTEIWASGVSWDGELPENIKRSWIDLKANLDGIPKLEFDRKSYDEEVVLVLFADSSKLGFGFCVYAVCEDNGTKTSNLVVAKSKVAPSKTRSLPTLELMAAFMALKCLNVILSSFDNKVKSVTIALDAQIVLTWILTNKVKVKNIAARNRIRDISTIRNDLLDKYGINCKFRYIQTDY